MILRGGFDSGIHCLIRGEVVAGGGKCLLHERHESADIKPLCDEPDMHGYTDVMFGRGAESA